MNLEDVILTGKSVRLEPLSYSHAAGLLEASCYDEIWTYLDEPTPQTLPEIEEMIRTALAEKQRHVRLPFAIIDLRDGRVVGSISFIDIRSHDRGVEIGWAWLAPRVWGDGFNAEAMLLLMQYAFETVGVIRVAIKADVRNVRSIRSMERIGASREGVWRNHRILSDGFHRDSIFYSVIDTEWPTIAERAILTEV
jgi:N-acetyltransferase